MHHFQVKVYYEDTDLAGIVYYANYLKFIERARSEAVADVGIDQVALKVEHGIVFVVRQLNAEFLQSARFSEVLNIATSVTKLGNVQLRMQQVVTLENKEIFTADVTLAIVNEQGKPTRLPAETRQKLQHLVM